MPQQAPGASSSETPLDSGTIAFECGPFAPAYYPETVRVTRKRRVKANDAPCTGEYVADHGGKNRTAHVKGVLLLNNVDSFNAMLNAGEPMNFVSEKWGGEVLVKKGEMSDLVGWDPTESSWWCNFTLDVKSTGRDSVEPDNGGIVSGAGGG